MTEASPMTLHGYWRSSASYRVRIALGLKGLTVQHATVNLKDGHQHTPEHARLNTQALVPVLEITGGDVLTQSAAILEYLEETHPTPALLPSHAIARARVRAAANIIGSDIAPIQNLRVLRQLKSQFGADDDGVTAWVQKWITSGLESLEAMLDRFGKGHAFIFQDQPGYGECFLIPQLYNARRFGVDVTAYPLIAAIDERCAALEVFRAAFPDTQPDAPKAD